MKPARLCLSLCLLFLLAAPAALAAPDYDLCALSKTALTSLPGHASGVLVQDAAGAPMVFSLDGQVMPNVYIVDAKLKARSRFQIDGQGTMLDLPHGFRAIRPSDLGPDNPRYALVDAEINGGKGVNSRNGMLITHFKRLDKNLPAQMTALQQNVNKLIASMRASIAPYLKQRPAGKRAQTIELSWMSSQHYLRVRFALFMHDKTFVREPGQKHRLMRFWMVPYLTVCYHVDSQGKTLARDIVPPADPVEAARHYNPGGSPW